MKRRKEKIMESIVALLYVLPFVLVELIRLCVALLLVVGLICVITWIYAICRRKDK